MTQHIAEAGLSFGSMLPGGHIRHVTTGRDGMKFSLNHMTAPQLALPDFFDLAKSLGIGSVEIRNDITGNAILDGTKPAIIAGLASDHGLEIITINALQRFNEWNLTREKEAIELASYARDCGAKALVLVPVNDGSGRADGERQANIRSSLAALKPILADCGLMGLVEPLGFGICSLRSKREALEAIDAVGGADMFEVVHDTFHHVLAGEPALFADRTGLVHISGVADANVAIDDMLDMHRVMVGPGDRLDNISQIKALIASGYDGYFSFEPFAASVHQHPAPAEMIAESIGFIRQGS
jgi:2-keto-myo-inositol isomerase